MGMFSISPYPSYPNVFPAANGPYVVGYTLCFTLMGALTIQTYSYFIRFPDDGRAIKALVTTIFILEILMTTMTFSGFWLTATDPMRTRMGLIEPQATNAPWGYVVFLSLAPITGLVTTLTHSFYCWRIATIWRSFLIPIPVMMLSLLQLASIIYLDLIDGLSPSSIRYEAPIPGSGPYNTAVYTFSPWLVTWLASSAICDFIITVCMIIILRPSQSQFSSSKSTLKKLSRLTIETGLVTTIAALLELILGILFKELVYHLAIFYMISKLYSIGLLTSLNFRIVVRSQSDPNISEIVWDDTRSNTQSRLSTVSIRLNRVNHILARVETDGNVATELDEEAHPVFNGHHVYGGDSLKNNLVSDPLPDSDMSHVIAQRLL